MRVLVDQFTILETMPPMHFLAFRGKLDAASGFQSEQFRETEFICGQKDEELRRDHAPDPEAYARLMRRLREPSLRDVFFQALGTISEPPATSGSKEEEREARVQVIRDLYQSERRHRDWIDVCERLIEFDELVLSWRLRHILTGGANDRDWNGHRRIPWLYVSAADPRQEVLSRAMGSAFDSAGGMKTPTITIAGAGLVGPLLAISLRQRGFPVDLYERRADMRRVQAGDGRSINLAVSARGIYALEQAGVWSELRDIVIPMGGRLMHLLTGELIFQPYGQDETEVINSVSRAALNIALLDAAEAAGAAIHFQQRCLGCARADDGIVVRLRDEQSGEETAIAAEVVIGADGSSSAVRGEMSRSPEFRLSEERLDYGYKELTIPAGQGGSHRMQTRALHIWPRGSYMLIALPNVDGTYGCILFLPFQGERGFAALDSESSVVEFFRANFPDALALMPNLAENYFANPTGAMVTVRCFPWHREGNILLLGDAAHAIVPFFGQGINCGFEDCTCFLELLDAARMSGAESIDWQKLFTDFESSRKPNTEAIADLALENFVEMRDRVADPHFLFKKKVDLALEARFPGLYMPKYAMVTFHRIPYAVAQQRGRIQDRLLDELCAGIDRLEDIDWSKAAKLVHRDLTLLGRR